MAFRLDPRAGDRLDQPSADRRRRRVPARPVQLPPGAARRGSRAVLSVPAWMLRGYQSANAGDLAAAVAFNALVSIIPVFLLLVSIGGLALQTDRLLITFIHAIFWALPQDETEAALTVVLGARRNSSWFGAVSLLGFAWVGANFVSCLARSMNKIYGVPNRRFVRQRGRDFLVVLVFAVLFLLASVAATLPSLFVGKELDVFFDAWALARGRIQILSYAVSILASLGLFLVLYRIVPNAGQKMRDVWPGILAASLLFVLLIQIFPVYLRLAGGMGRYGQAFGFIPIIVGWFYLLAHVLLFGTYVNATFRSHCGKGQGIAGYFPPGCGGKEEELG